MMRILVLIGIWLGLLGAWAQAKPSFYVHFEPMWIPLYQKNLPIRHLMIDMQIQIVGKENKDEILSQINTVQAVLYQTLAEFFTSYDWTQIPENSLQLVKTKTKHAIHDYMGKPMIEDVWIQWALERVL
jgi:hypothetical protein